MNIVACCLRTIRYGLLVVIVLLVVVECTTMKNDDHVSRAIVSCRLEHRIGSRNPLNEPPPLQAKHGRVTIATYLVQFFLFYSPIE
jgi:hypothetical protein